VAIALVIFAVLVRYLIKKYREDFRKFFHKIIKIVKFLISHPKLTIFSTIVFIALILFIYSIFIQNNYKSLEQKLPSLQDNLAEVATVKLMGDSIMAGRGVSNMWMGKIAKTAQTTSTNLKQTPTSEMLKDYKVAAIDWSDSIAKTATNTATWKVLSEKPPDFDLSLNDSKVAAYVNTSLQKVALLKEAGDIAIKRQDRQTMYYIAGQLLVQEHWLNGIFYSTNPGFLSFKNLVSPVMAFRFTPVKYKGPRCIVFSSKGAYVPKNCPEGNPQTPISFNKMMRAAVGYAAAQPGAEEQWNEITADDLKIDLPKTESIETQGGVYNGEPNLPPQLSQTEKTFVDECKAKGGTTGGTGGVYARMPTTQAGIACHHGNGCWDYLTRSNGHYSGGNQGCPEENLLPPPLPTATPKPIKKPTQTPEQPVKPGQPTQPPDNPTISSWDGIYSLRYNVSCNVPGYFSSGIMPSADSITVRGNQIIMPQVGDISINSSGYATMNFNANASGVSMQITQTFNFYNSGTAAVKGNLNLSGGGSYEGVNLDIRCSGSFSGNRQ